MKTSSDAAYRTNGSFNLLQELLPETRALLYPKLRKKICQPGKLIWYGEISCNHIYFFRWGKALLYRHTPCGRLLKKELVRPGALFGTLHWIGDSGFDYAEVLTASTLCSMDVQQWERMLLCNQQLSTALLQWMNKRIYCLELEYICSASD